MRRPVSRKTFQRVLIALAAITLLPLAILKAPWPAILRGNVSYLVRLNPILLQAHLGTPDKIETCGDDTIFKYFVCSWPHDNKPYRISLHSRTGKIKDAYKITSYRNGFHTPTYDSDPESDFESKP